MEMNQVLDLAYDYLEDPAKVDKWLKTKNPVLDNQSPIDFIAKGGVDKLLKILAQ